MDSFATKEGAIALNINNRVSTRSTRKSKSKVPTPKKLIDSLTGKVPSRKLGEGVISAHKELIRESPTFFAFFKEENTSKNLKPNEVFLYDWSRVVLSDDPDYYHASYVDGCVKAQQYILAQAPFNSTTQTDFYRMINQIHPDSIVLMDSESSPDMKFVLPQNYSGNTIPVKAEDEQQKGDGYTTRNLLVNKNKIKLYFIDGWKDDAEPPKDFVNVYEKIRRSIGLDSKNILILVCKDGCSRSSLYCLLDIEAERFRLKGRMKFGDTVRHIRYQRSNCFDTQEQFAMGISLIMILAKKYQDKGDASFSCN
ncbi:Protein-tyrosine phosphatase [Dictyocaulus viviparus]|uniref:Protein-tyrosine phosphatase n=1 Tax=Dictyocaulus viviparus TaxID=29172 RepID=A0A0D8XGC9_DICVI|nr:Protein-tyrosine phosphatase [Dictyocaulus viviparus]